MVGGMDTIQQGGELSRKPHVVIATPGRLAGLIQGTNDFSLKNIKFLVLDEADRMLEKSFEKDLEVVKSQVFLLVIGVIEITSIFSIIHPLFKLLNHHKLLFLLPHKFLFKPKYHHNLFNRCA